MSKTAIAETVKLPSWQPGGSSRLRGGASAFGKDSRRRPEIVAIPQEQGRQMPPIRIFVGTCSAAFRAERMLAWSILQQRDPGRAYEIHLMKDLAGYERASWPSAYAGYRFAVPALAGGRGRAIYCDVGDVFTTDPAALFEMDMADAGVLVSAGSSGSPMLVDCELMQGVWPLDRLRTGADLDMMRHAAGRAGLVGMLHGERFDMSADWQRDEPAADRAGYTIFTKSRQSQRYRDLLALHQRMHEEGRPEEDRGPEKTFNGKSLAEHIEPVGDLLRRHRTSSILDFGAGKGALYRDHPDHPAGSRFKAMDAWPGVLVTCYDPGYPAFAKEPAGPYDGVISTDVVEHIPEDDIPWILDEIFGHARRFVYVVAACFPAKKKLPNGENAHVTIQPPEWWQSQMERASARNPAIDWTLCAQTKVKIGPLKRERHLLFHGSAR